MKVAISIFIAGQSVNYAHSNSGRTIPSVRLSVTLRYCVKMAKPIVEILSPRDSPISEFAENYKWCSENPTGSLITGTLDADGISWKFEELITKLLGIITEIEIWSVFKRQSRGLLSVAESNRFRCRKEHAARSAVLLACMQRCAIASSRKPWNYSRNSIIILAATGVVQRLYRLSYSWRVHVTTRISR